MYVRRTREKFIHIQTQVKSFTTFINRQSIYSLIMLRHIFWVKRVHKVHKGHKTAKIYI